MGSDGPSASGKYEEKSDFIMENRLFGYFTPAQGIWPAGVLFLLLLTLYYSKQQKMKAFKIKKQGGFK